MKVYTKLPSPYAEVEDEAEEGDGVGVGVGGVNGDASAEHNAAENTAGKAEDNVAEYTEGRGGDDTEKSVDDYSNESAEDNLGRDYKDAYQSITTLFRRLFQLENLERENKARL